MAHIFVMGRMIEDEKQWCAHQNIANGSTFLAIDYDELHRQSIAHRAFRKVEKETLALAKTKLADALQRSGISRSRPQQQPQDSSKTCSAVESVQAQSSRFGGAASAQPEW